MNVTSATTMAPRAPLTGIPVPGPGERPGVDSSRSVVELPGPAPDATPEPPATAPDSKAWMAWFDLNGDGLIQNFPVSEGGDAYMPGAVDVGRRAVPVDDPEPAPRLEVPGSRSAEQTADANLVGARLQRAAETYRRDGGSPEEEEIDPVADRLHRLVEAVERQVKPHEAREGHTEHSAPDQAAARRHSSTAA